MKKIVFIMCLCFSGLALANEGAVSADKGYFYTQFWLSPSKPGITTKGSSTTLGYFSDERAQHRTFGYVGGEMNVMGNARMMRFYPAVRIYAGSNSENHIFTEDTDSNGNDSFTFSKIEYSAIALGARMQLNIFPRISLNAEGYYAEGIMAHDNARDFYEYSTSVRVQAVKEMYFMLGYRKIKLFDQDLNEDVSIFDGTFFGIGVGR